ncbi:Hypothetical protein Mbur_0129 [Methanococcoides burtonii DSM 6242]|uniref:Rubrerythrin n=1 Tax=Methanococcoides burtonii (strain DSM 6242 / NBRC 107633 / OCM 468 / ACE-M) TaxID=259564 RepID=Q12ZI0_METBU|nr:Hypothetical protein Mbur_0129 [Methanococcoides burtonii DSM 6242]
MKWRDQALNSNDEKEILLLYLQRMYWVETEMEQPLEWEAKIELQGEFRDALEILSSDSDRHAMILEKWMKVLDIELPKEAPRGISKKIFDFKGESYYEIFSEIMKYEIFARDAYETIANTDENLLKEIFPEEDTRKQFLQSMNYLVTEEERHRTICAEKVGGYSTIISSPR